MKFLILAVILLLALPTILGIIYVLTGIGKRFYHDTLGWHIPNGTYGFDGLSFTSHCKYCGKEIMQDSQGNWF